MCKPLREVIQKHQTMASSAASDASGGSVKNKMKVKVEFFVEALANLRNKPLQKIRCRLHPKETSKPLFNALFKFPSICEETGHQSFPFFDIFMLHPNFDINGRIAPIEDKFITPLQAICIEIVESLRKLDLPEFRAMLRGAEILLSLGADPNLGVPGFGTPIQFLRRNKMVAQAQHQDVASFHDEQGKHWDEAMALLER